jgi:hypothetical protein
MSRPLWPGGATFTLFAAAATFALVRAHVQGWTSVATLGVLGLGLVALIAFVTIELRSDSPLFDLALLRGPLAGILIGSLLYNMSAFGMLVYASIWLQSILGLGPIAAGAVTVPLSIVAVVVSAAGGRLVHAVPPGAVLGSGGALNTARQLGTAFGIAVFDSIFSSRIADHLADQTHGSSLAGDVGSGGAQGVLAHTPVAIRASARRRRARRRWLRARHHLPRRRDRRSDRRRARTRADAPTPRRAVLADHSHARKRDPRHSRIAFQVVLGVNGAPSVIEKAGSSAPTPGEQHPAFVGAQIRLRPFALDFVCRAPR